MEDDYVLAASNRSLLHPGNWLRRQIRPAAEKLGFIAEEFARVVVHHENVDSVVHGLTDVD